MKYSSTLLSAIALAPAVLGQSSSGTASASASAASGSAAANGSDFQAYVQTLLGALNGAGLTTLADIATQVAGTPEGAQLLSALPQGNKTVFAPSNDAFAAVPESISSNVTALTQILSYHITERAWLPSGVSVSPQHSIAHTYLNGGMYTLPNNRTAPLVLERESANATTIRIVQGNITQAQGPVAAANLQVYIIDEVLSLPGNLTTVLTDLAPAFAQIVPEQVVTALQESTGFTVFVPNSEAISAAGSLLGQLNDTTIQNVLFNHVINGSVAYSTTIASGVNLTSAGGQPFMFMTNGTGTFVTSGNSTAQIVAPDIILENGVAHVINGVLANTASDTQAADQAQESQASQIATQTEPTTPATQTSDPSNTQGSGGGSGGGASGGASAAPSGAASPMAPLGLTSTMLGGALGVVAAVAGGAFVLF